MQQEVQDLARLKTAHDLAVQEYGQGWEGILTLRTGRQNEAALRKDIVSYFKRHLRNQPYKLSLHRSVYLHRIDSDVHAHCYVRHEYEQRTIGEAEIDSMMSCWIDSGEMRSVGESKKQQYKTLYVHYKAIDKDGAEHGNFASYGIGDARDSDYLVEANSLKYEGDVARARGLKYMAQHRHTTRYQNMLEQQDARN